MTTIETRRHGGDAAPPEPEPRTRRIRRRELTVTMAIALSVVVVVAGSVFPVGKVLATALSPEALPVYVDVVAKPVYRTVLLNTMVLGLLVGVCGTALGFLFAFVQTRLDVPGKRVLHVLAMVPIVSPPFAVATAAIVLYGRRGVISNQLLGCDSSVCDIYGLDGLVLVLSLSLFPVAYLGLLGMMRALDPALEEAAMNLGASRWRVFRTVLLPLLAPGLAAPFLLLFVEAIADLANPLAIGGDYNVLASQAYLAINSHFDRVSATVYCVILLLPAIGVFAIQRYWLSRRVRTTVTGRPSGSVHLITSWVRWPIYGLAIAVCAVIVSLYGTVIAGAMTVNFGVDNRFTTRNLRTVFGAGREALQDTTLLAVIATPIAGIVGVLIAWLVVRHLRRIGGLLDFAGTLGVAIPGTVLGIGYLLAYSDTRGIGSVPIVPQIAAGGAVAGGAVAIVMAYVTRSVPAGLRTASAALTQLHPNIEEASRDLGAGSLRTLWRVTLPLIRTSLLAGLSYSFARSMTSISTIVLLVTADTKIITSQVLNAVSNNRYGEAFAYCSVLTAIVLAAFGVIRLVVGGRGTPYRIADKHRKA